MVELLGIKEIIKEKGINNKLCKGEYFQETFEKYIYLVDKGILYVHQDNIDGITLIYKIIGPDSLFICDNSKYFCGKTEVVFYKMLISSIINDEKTCREYIKLLINENVKKDMFIRDMLTKDKVCRLLSILVRLANTFGEEEGRMIVIKIKITQEELAQYCGTTRENIARIMKQLKDRKIVDTSSRFIKILSLEEIKQMIPCEGCNSFVCKTF
ncbi:Crp/Fnr family transcriptional regulator [Staphylococcus pseudintermedius]|nr:Crp/Fnr family transcriptional regulator [Staphylococcus pseudintermedius]